MEAEAAFVGTKGGIVLKRNKDEKKNTNSCKLANLDAESSVHLWFSKVILPDDAELENTLRDLNDFQRFLVFRFGL
jgi:hypothetical protein